MAEAFAREALGRGFRFLSRQADIQRDLIGAISGKSILDPGRRRSVTSVTVKLTRRSSRAFGFWFAGTVFWEPLPAYRSSLRSWL